jgi:signal transduction histidine kinase
MGNARCGVNATDQRAAVEQVRVLLIEDDSIDARTVAMMLSQARGAMEVRRGLFSVTAVDTLAPALELLSRDTFGVILLDLQLPDSDGLQTLADVRAVATTTPIIVLTGFDDEGLALRAIQQGAQDYLTKDDLDRRMLIRTIRYAIERKRSEAQLDRINRELDEFAYLASHDLKEPLRGIKAYCDILLEDYGGKLDEPGQQRLVKLGDLCHRLENLISDLLTYCRLGGVRPAATGVELGEVVDEVLETLGPSIERRGATVQVEGRLPTATGDPMLIGIALSNLVANGLKFNQSPQPRVEIGCLPTQPPTLFVRDNGIGIPPEHHESIFTIFRRLHARHQYEGTGVGLSIVQKIVQSHGGRIWLESQPGAGTTFYFTLAPADEKPALEAGPRAPHWIEHADVGRSFRSIPIAQS